jgi:hypothetical protein
MFERSRRSYWLYALYVVFALIMASQLDALHGLRGIATLAGFAAVLLALLLADRVALARRWNGLPRAALAIAITLLLLVGNIASTLTRCERAHTHCHRVFHV